MKWYTGFLALAWPLPPLIFLQKYGPLLPSSSKSSATTQQAGERWLASQLAGRQQSEAAAPYGAASPLAASAPSHWPRSQRRGTPVQALGHGSPLLSLASRTKTGASEYSPADHGMPGSM